MGPVDANSEGTLIPLFSWEEAAIANADMPIGKADESGREELELPIDEAGVAGAESDLATVLDQVMAILTRFVAFSDTHQAIIATLYVAATHSVAQWWTVPYLHITSPQPDSGKSTLLKVLSHLVHNPVVVAFPSTAWLYRKLSEEPATLLVDEFDNLMSSDKELSAALKGILNVGYDKESAWVGRTTGPGHSPIEFECFGFKVLSGIGGIDKVLATRALQVRLHPALPGEIPEFYDPAYGHRDQVRAVGESLAKAMETSVLAVAVPIDMPQGLDNRLAQLWRPLLAVADSAGKEWPKLARASAVWTIKDRPDTNPRIIADLAFVLENDGNLKAAIRSKGRGSVVPTSDLIDALCRIEDGEWSGTQGRRRLTSRRLGETLKQYDLHLGHRFGRGDDRTPRGLLLAEVENKIARYAPPLPQQ